MQKMHYSAVVVGVVAVVVVVVECNDHFFVLCCCWAGVLSKSWMNVALHTPTYIAEMVCWCYVFFF